MKGGIPAIGSDHQLGGDAGGDSAEEDFALGCFGITKADAGFYGFKETFAEVENVD